MEWLWIGSFIILCIFAIIGAACCVLGAYAIYSDKD